MDREEIQKRVEILIANSLNGLEAESPKFDFKIKWYDLKDRYKINEFIKDTTAIVNTVGLDGYIVIGYNDKTQQFQPAKFSDCGLKDSADLQNLITKKCSDIFDVNSYDFEINKNKISVLHIPPFKFKPVVIPNFETVDKKGNIKQQFHKIFVRKNSMTSDANKNDLDKMYYDRKNVEVEFEYYIDILRVIVRSEDEMLSSGDVALVNKIVLEYTLENLGRRTLAIKNSKILTKVKDVDITLFAKRQDEKHTYFGENFRRKKTLLNVVPKNINTVISQSYHGINKAEKVYLAKESKLEMTLILTLSNGKIIMKKFDYSRILNKF